jgi:phage-related protein
VSTGLFTYNAVDPGTYGVRLLDRGEDLLPAARSYRMALPGRNGEHEFPSDLGLRVFDMKIWCVQASASALATNLDSISQLFDPTQGTKQLIFDLLSTRYYLARVDGTFQITRRFTVSADLSVRMVCADPLAYATTQSTPTSASSPLAITPSGTFKVQPVIDLVCGNTYSGNIVFTNAATGESLTWNGSVVNTDTIRVECDTFRVRKNGALAMSGLMPGSVFFALLPGVSNSISVTGPTITSITATYRARWLY